MGEIVICLSFNPPSVLQPRESEIGKESESKKRSVLKPSLREKMFRLHNYSPFSLGLGSGSLLLLLSSSFLDFSMNPRRLAGPLLSFKELSRRYFLHFLCYSLFSVFLFYVLGLALSWEAGNFMSQHFCLVFCSTFLWFSHKQ